MSGCKLVAGVSKHVNQASSFITTDVAGGQDFMWQCLIFSAYFLQFLYIQQRIQGHMYQADSDWYLRFLGNFSIVCTQYGSHFMSPCCHLEFGDGPYIFGNLSHTHTPYKTKIIFPLPGDCCLLSIHHALWIWFVMTHQCYFVFEGVLRIWNPTYPSAK
jgi:hypothetical protein